MKTKVSDYIADFFARRGEKHVFAISGAGDVHLLDSIARHPDLSYICPHQEQAGVMASLAYYRISNRLGIMITTSGGSASNAVTGVLDAWADSIPCLVISGQERSNFATRANPLRMWGVQGFDIAKMVEGVTKYSALVEKPTSIRYHLEKAWYMALSGRPGPVWLDIPTDVQAAQIDPETLSGFTPEAAAQVDLSDPMGRILEWLKKAERPVFWIGNGIRLAGGQDLVHSLMEKFPVPFLTAWNGADLVPTNHARHFGHAGNYGQRCANFVVQNSDLLITVGTRLAIPQIGYDLTEFARAAKKVTVDADPVELAKFDGQPDWLCLQADARYFITQLLHEAEKSVFAEPKAWLERCNAWRRKYPLYDPSIHHTEPGAINSYEFTQRLSKFFADDEVIVTDMGAALTCTHQAIVLDKRQRLVTSTGLGEMGFGLPGAIGACLAREKKRVILITGDGSIMMNLQEFQTVIHHNLPIKMFLYVNDAYLSIKHTQTALFGDNRFTASGSESGVSCPNFSEVGKAFGFRTFQLRDPADIEAMVEKVLATAGPVLCEIAMAPLQPLVPKLSFAVQSDGSLVSPPIEDLYPFLPRKELKEQMVIELHPKSLKIEDK
ncbi:MAG: thiamine pyrophosphate-binding protein [Bacteroidetes bacterium]|nr:thiamine pyrophosphate-binding protein [Bacteroidota bacterium]